MFLRVDKDELQAALAISAAKLTPEGKFTETEQVRVDDIYENVMLEVSPGKGAFIHATNGNVWTKSRLMGESRGDFQVLIRNSQFAQMIPTLDSGVVEIRLLDGASKVSLSSGAFAAEFGVRPAVEYPAMAEPDGAWTPLPHEFLKAMVAAVESCVYDKPDRPYLCGVNLTVADDCVMMVAADGARIAVAKLRTAERIGGYSQTLPVALARHAARMAVLGPIDFCLTKMGAAFRGEGSLVMGKVNSYPFPDWKSAKNLPKKDSPGTTCIVDRKKALRAAKRVIAVLGAGQKHRAWMDVSVSPGGLNLVSLSGDKRAVETVPLHQPGVTAPETIGRRINGAYFVQALADADTDLVVIIVPKNPDMPVGVVNMPKPEAVQTITWIMPRDK